MLAGGFDPFINTAWLLNYYFFVHSLIYVYDGINDVDIYTIFVRFGEQCVVRLFTFYVD